MKGPIPSEHLVLQDTFNGLAERCKNTANNPVSNSRATLINHYALRIFVYGRFWNDEVDAITWEGRVVILDIDRRAFSGKIEAQ